jgi:hypothetical protein
MPDALRGGLPPVHAFALMRVRAISIPVALTVIDK